MTYELSTPVTFDLDDDGRDQKVQQFIDWVYRSYGENMYNFFIENADAILENKLQRPWGDFPAGMKLSRVLMQEFGANAEEVRQKLSMLIQSNKVTGKLVISVHPLDFLSASENNHGWRSCHSLDGEYRSGNMSYMCDNCTFIAYLKSDSDDVKLPRFPEDVPWNDKKWRCYFFMDWVNNLCYAGRQYPFHTDRGLELVAEMLHDLKYFVDSPDYVYCGFGIKEIAHHKFHHWGIKGETDINGEKYFFNQTKVVCGYDDTKVVPLNLYINTHKEAMCFNDLLDSHTYSPYIMKYKGEEYMPKNVDHKLTIGAPTPCICCGKNNAANSDVFVCAKCAAKYNIGDNWHCSGCGDILNGGDICYIYEDEVYCETCFNSNFTYCEDCNRLTPYNRTYHINNNFYCPTCAARHNHDPD